MHYIKLCPILCLFHCDVNSYTARLNLLAHMVQTKPILDSGQTYSANEISPWYAVLLSKNLPGCAFIVLFKPSAMLAG